MQVWTISRNDRAQPMPGERPETIASDIAPGPESPAKMRIPLINSLRAGSKLGDPSPRQWSPNPAAPFLNHRRCNRVWRNRSLRLELRLASSRLGHTHTLALFLFLPVLNF